MNYSNQGRSQNPPPRGPNYNPPKNGRRSVTSDLQTGKNHSGKRKPRKKLPKVYRLLIKLGAALLAAVIVYIILYAKVFSYKTDINDVLLKSPSTDISVIDDIKVDQTHYVYVFTSGGKLCASYIEVKESNGEYKYKCLKRGRSLELSSFKDDLEGRNFKYTKSGGFRFALDFLGSDQYNQFEKYFEEESIKDQKASPVYVDGYDDLFVLWMWTE